MVGYGAEISLAWCVLLNVLVFGSAYRFAVGQVTKARGQAILDAALLGYVIQYISVGVPGMLGTLGPTSITATAIVISVMLWMFASRRIPDDKSNRSRFAPLDCAVTMFAVTFVIAIAYGQSPSPVTSNDALTYHFPAAVQWLQTGRIGLFQTWFFNPANTYSPLAGSTFIAWLLFPFGNDVLARFVEVPALLFTGVGVFQLCRQLRVAQTVAIVTAAAAILSRPFLSQSIMGKDDLFVTAFFVCALVALSPERSGERFGAIRLGMALGMLAATKYTALLNVPILLLAIDGPFVARWRWRQWIIAGATAILLAGPWYLRNIWLTGNPLFPIDISIAGFHLCHGLFIPARSEGLRSVGTIMHVLMEGNYGLPWMLALVLGIGWCVSITVRPRRILIDPLFRTIMLGPIIGIALFVWRSPFPEVRFVFPSILLIFFAMAIAIQLLRTPRWTQLITALLVLVLSVATAFVLDVLRVITPLVVTSIIISGIGASIAWITRSWTARHQVALLGIFLLMGVGFTFVYWSSYVHDYQEDRFGNDSVWASMYVTEEPMWQFVNDRIPATATLAYTNTYLVYPLQGFTLTRRVVYAPTRPGVETVADLPWLGNAISGEQLVSVTDAAAVANADRATWLKNLRETHATFLLVAKGGAISNPPEAAFVAVDPMHFQKIYDDPAGMIYSIDWHDRTNDK